MRVRKCSVSLRSGSTIAVLLPAVVSRLLLICTRSCEPGHYYNRGSRRCARCTAKHAGTLVVVAVGLVVLVVCVYAALRAAFPIIKHPDATGALKILIATYQIVQAVLWHLDQEWPRAMDVTLRFMALLQLDFPSECLLRTNFFTRVYITSAFPPVVLLVIALVYAIRRWCLPMPARFSTAGSRTESRLANRSEERR